MIEEDSGRKNRDRCGCQKILPSTCLHAQNTVQIHKPAWLEGYKSFLLSLYKFTESEISWLGQHTKVQYAVLMVQGLESDLFWLTRMPNPLTFLDDKLNKRCPANELIMSCEFCCWVLVHLCHCEFKEKQRQKTNNSFLTLEQKIK